jgi:hypothetical protein
LEQQQILLWLKKFEYAVSILEQKLQKISFVTNEQVTAPEIVHYTRTVSFVIKQIPRQTVEGRGYLNFSYVNH